MKHVELSPRLEAVARLVSQGARLVDVGTDHAYLPVWLLQQGRLDHAIVTDLRSGPLARARATAERYGVTDQLSFRLCNGLSAVSADEADTITIAGMGGETMAQILEEAPWLQNTCYHLILQPMSSIPDLRKWLSEHGFFIEEEHLSCEGNSLYNIFDVRYKPEESALTLIEQWLGRAGEKNPFRTAYLEMLQRRYEKMLHGLKYSKKTEDALKYRTLEIVYRALEEELEERKRTDGNCT